MRSRWGRTTVAGTHVLESRSETPARTVEPTSGRDGETPEHGRDLGRRQALPLGEEQDLSVARPQQVEHVVHE